MNTEVFDLETFDPVAFERTFFEPFILEHKIADRLVDLLELAYNETVKVTPNFPAGFPLQDMSKKLAMIPLLRASIEAGNVSFVLEALSEVSGAMAKQLQEENPDYEDPTW